MSRGAGRLRYRITLSSYGQTRGPKGEVLIVFTYLDSVFAQYRPVSGRELVAGGEIQGEQYVEFMIRYRDDIGVSDQIEFQCQKYDIQSTSLFGIGNEYLKVIGKLRDAR